MILCFLIWHLVTFLQQYNICKVESHQSMEEAIGPSEPSQILGNQVADETAI